jgi:hypothetical protein
MTAGRKELVISIVAIVLFVAIMIADVVLP